MNSNPMDKILDNIKQGIQDGLRARDKANEFKWRSDNATLMLYDASKIALNAMLRRKELSEELGDPRDIILENAIDRLMKAVHDFMIHGEKAEEGKE